MPSTITEHPHNTRSTTIMSILAASRRNSSASATQQDPSPLPIDYLLFLSSAGWVAGLSLTSLYTSLASLSLAPSSQSALQLTSLTPHSQSSQHHMLPDMPVPTFEHGHYMTMVSVQLFQNRRRTHANTGGRIHNFLGHLSLSWYRLCTKTCRVRAAARKKGFCPSHPRSMMQKAKPTPHRQKPQKSPRSQNAAVPIVTKTRRPLSFKYVDLHRVANSFPSSVFWGFLIADTLIPQRRRAANRKSQRAYRKRKDDRIAELEELLDEATKREQQVSHAYVTLRAEFEQLLMIGSPESTSHHGRSPSVASICAAASAPPPPPRTTGATTELQEEEVAASKFLALVDVSQQNGGAVSPQLAHIQQQQPASSPHLLSVYPPPPM